MPSGRQKPVREWQDGGAYRGRVIGQQCRSTGAIAGIVAACGCRRSFRRRKLLDDTGRPLPDVSVHEARRPGTPGRRAAVRAAHPAGLPYQVVLHQPLGDVRDRRRCEPVIPARSVRVRGPFTRIACNVTR